MYQKFYGSLTITTKQKPRVDSQKIEETEHATMENHQFTKIGKNKGRRKQWNYKRPKKQLIRWHQ